MKAHQLILFVVLALSASSLVGVAAEARWKSRTRNRKDYLEITVFLHDHSRRVLLDKGPVAYFGRLSYKLVRGSLFRTQQVDKTRCGQSNGKPNLRVLDLIIRRSYLFFRTRVYAGCKQNEKALLSEFKQAHSRRKHRYKKVCKPASYTFRGKIGETSRSLTLLDNCSSMLLYSDSAGLKLKLGQPDPFKSVYWGHRRHPSKKIHPEIKIRWKRGRKNLRLLYSDRDGDKKKRWKALFQLQTGS